MGTIERQYLGSDRILPHSSADRPLEGSDFSGGLERLRLPRPRECKVRRDQSSEDKTHA